MYSKTMFVQLADNGLISNSVCNFKAIKGVWRRMNVVFCVFVILDEQQPTKSAIFHVDVPDQIK